MKELLGLGLLAVALFACSGGVSTNNSGGAGGAGGADAGATCAAFVGDSPTSVTLRIENHTAATIFLVDSCDQSGPDGVRVDGQSVLETWEAYSCDDLLACKPQGADCFGSPDMALAPGASYEHTWDGRLLAADPKAMPDACRPGCTGSDGFPYVCRRALAAAPGSHTLTILYSNADKGPMSTLTVPFSLPTTLVTATFP
jgi:hypothetical protein